jgi:hypothetical protein
MERRSCPAEVEAAQYISHKTQRQKRRRQACGFYDASGIGIVSRTREREEHKIHGVRAIILQPRRSEGNGRFPVLKTVGSSRAEETADLTYNEALTSLIFSRIEAGA